jgi:hypothetical protein
MVFTSAAQKIAYNNILGRWEVSGTRRFECQPEVLGTFYGTRREAVRLARETSTGCYSAVLMDKVRWSALKQEWVKL